VNETTNSKFIGHFACVLVYVDLAETPYGCILVEPEGCVLFVTIDMKYSLCFLHLATLLDTLNPIVERLTMSKIKICVPLRAKNVIKYIPKKS